MSFDEADTDRQLDVLTKLLPEIDALLQSQNFQEASERLVRYRERAIEQQQVSLAAWCSSLLSTALELAGRYDEAFRVAEETDRLYGSPVAGRSAAEQLLRMGRIDEAEAKIRKHLEWRDSLPALELHAALTLFGRVLVARRAYDAAARTFDEAWSIAQQQNLPAGQWDLSLAVDLLEHRTLHTKARSYLHNALTEAAKASLHARQKLIAALLQHPEPY